MRLVLSEILTHLVPAVAVLVCLIMLIGRRHRRRNTKAIVTAWPVVGMLPSILRNRARFHDYTTEFLRKSGGTFEFQGPKWLANLDFVMTCDPLNIQHILSTNFANYPKGDEFRDVFDSLGDGILNVDGDLWRLQRKMFQLWNARQSKSGFISKTIQRKVVDDLIPFLDHASEAGIQVDLQEALQEMITFDNSMSLIFGFEVASSSDFRFSKAEYRRAFNDLQQTSFHRHVTPQSVWKIQRWLQIGGERRYRRALKVFYEFMCDCLSLKRRELEQSRHNKLGEKEEEEEEEEEEEYSNLDMMAIYLEEKQNPLLDKFLKDVAFNLTAASRDSITAVLTWFFWLIATHPSVEAKILEELRENLPPKDDHNGKDGVLRADDLNKLVYLQAALYETLRLYPPLPFNRKTAAEADILPSGHSVEAKKRILISFYATGRMEEIWGEDCLEFKPERWITVNADQRGKRFVHVSPHKFPAFNVGPPRTCLGKDMALIQAKVVAINDLRAYRLRVVEGHPIVPHLTITLHMRHGLKINVSKRWDW